jgi:hypothetical protein
MTLSRSALCLALLGAAQPPANSDDIMNRIEALVAMPQGASSLTLYGRYYALEVRSDGVVKVLGVYVREPSPRRHWVKQNELPLVMDGGCDIVTLTYDARLDRVDRIECNGVG